MLLYFSYGSNMFTPRLLKRVPSAQVISVAQLNSHRLKFHKISKKDGSAKCDIEKTNNPDDVVYGVVFRMLASEKPELDKAEGLGQGYNEKPVSIVGLNGESFNAVTYYATNIDSSLKPYDWYKEHVLRGANEHKLPPDYIKSFIEAIESIADLDTEREKMEQSIYHS